MTRYIVAAILFAPIICVIIFVGLVRRASRPRPQRPLHFLYRTGDGAPTERILLNWKDDAETVTGTCIVRREERTFRKSRVIEWGPGVEQLSVPYYRSHASQTLPRGVELASIDQARGACRNASQPVSIWFIGWLSEQREDLEFEAGYRGVTVRQSLTKDLTLICAGPRAGARAMDAAQAQSIPIVSWEVLAQLLREGWGEPPPQG